MGYVGDIHLKMSINSHIYSLGGRFIKAWRHSFMYVFESVGKRSSRMQYSWVLYYIAPGISSFVKAVYHFYLLTAYKYYIL